MDTCHVLYMLCNGVYDRCVAPDDMLKQSITLLFYNRIVSEHIVCGTVKSRKLLLSYNLDWK
jgi:hypothetical protein